MQRKALFYFTFLLAPWVVLAQTQVGQNINGEGDSDRSGSAVALSTDGSVLAIGAPQNTPGQGLIFAGHVRVFQEENNSWTQVGNDIDGESGVRFYRQ
ncbi:MAG: hypothetical protein ACI81P_000196 [Neolewinella sp.]|jgi:hypothetical protein